MEHIVKSHVFLAEKFSFAKGHVCMQVFWFFFFSFFFWGVLIAVVVCMFCINIFDQNFPKDCKKVREKQGNLLYFFLRCAYHQGDELLRG